MIRAGIFIGVDRTGDLRALEDAARGAERMRDWAVDAGAIAPDNARLITDAGGARVRPDDIYDAIRGFVDGPGVDQLIVYFAGHGMNINRSEVWLLSEAPERTSAAVNVLGSVELARYCGIPHVVMISDACRVAPDSIRAQNVVGQDVFPNASGSDRSHPVDQMFACRLGRTAAEVLDPDQAAAGYTALYTEELLHALHGRRAGLLEAARDPGDPGRYLYPRRLAEHLEAALPRIVAERGLIGRVNQVPDAIITSHERWLARVEHAHALPAWIDRDSTGADATEWIGAGTDGGRRKTLDPPRRPLPRLPPRGTTVRPSGPVIGAKGFPDISRGPVRRPAPVLAELPGTMPLRGLHDPELKLAALRRLAAPFGPDRFDTACGIKVRGMEVAAATAAYADLRRLDAPLPLIQVDAIDGPAASVLLRFADGSGALVPAIRGHVAALRFEAGELVDVAWEPAAGHPRWNGYAARKDALRTLRAVAAAATRNGRFRLDAEGAEALERDLRHADGLDPALALYAAYARHEADLEPVARIGGLSRQLYEDIDATLFDLALLARQLRGRRVGPTDMIVPCVPLLSQGWALLRAHGVELHPALQGLETAVRQSPWSLYDRAGADRLERALSTREVR